MELMITASAFVSLLTQVLKKMPKIPVNSSNALVVVLVLAVILAFAPVVLGGSLASSNAEDIAANAAGIFGASVIIYEAIKAVWSKIRPSK